MTSLQLTPGKFDAVHCRVTHPAFTGMDHSGFNLNAINIKEKFKFNDNDNNEKLAIEAAIHGIQCVDWIHTTTIPTYEQSNETKSIYFFSDSTDLGRTMVQDHTKGLSNLESHDLVSNVTKLQSEFHIVGRPDISVVHLLNNDKKTPSDAFFSTFVDLYIAAYARCLSLGVGNYAYLSAKIKQNHNDDDDPTICWVRHQLVPQRVAKNWGMLQSTTEIPTCSI